jgi:citrate synthase
MVDDDYISAEEAAALLGVTIDTFYVYVTRKNLRSTGIPNSRKRRYWRADVEQLRGRGRKPPASPTDLDAESSITLLTEDNLFYRGLSVRELVNRPTFESVAALLWDVDADAVFGESLPAFPDTVTAVRRALAGESPLDQAIALFPLIEKANPRSQDFSPAGMARTGGDVLRAFTALIAGHDRPDRRPMHISIAEAFGLSDRQAALMRRVMILAADHGLEPATFAVRAIASTGVSPWRAVSTGLTIAIGRKTRPVQFAAIGRLVQIYMGFQVCDAIAGFLPATRGRDVRATVLLDLLEADYARDADFQHLMAAIGAARDIGGHEPSFALLGAFAGLKLGLRSREATFFLARAAGWIAHAIEQSLGGERERHEPHYRGPLPGL